MMKNKQMKSTWSVILAGASVLAWLHCSGCATTSRRMFYAGQAADALTTYEALERNDGFHEAGAGGDFKGVLLSKVVVIGAVEFVAWLYPESAKTCYRIGSFVGFGAAGFNVYGLATH